MFKMMQKIVCFLLLWNVFLTAGLLINIHNKQEKELNQQICDAELIPLEVIEESF